MLQIRDLDYSIGDRHLLRSVNWVIQPGRRTALIGPNGTGKTTLLRILTGEIETPPGAIHQAKGYRMGYLPQETIAMGNRSILQTVLDGQEELMQLEQHIARLHDELEKSDSPGDNLLKQLGDLEHRYEAMDGYHLEATAKSILSGLGFTRDDFSRPLTEFSGGWRMRVYLSLLLVRKPDLLLLDEPSNHLDIPSLEWLEQYLLGFKGSIIIVSHDRFFIDRLAQEIMELDRGKLTAYSGNYHLYERQKEQREEMLLKKWKELKTERERQERFINRFRYKDSKASAVQSRVKQLEKMETVELAPPPPRLNFKLQVDVSSYKDVLTIDTLSFKYDTDWVLRQISLDMHRGDRVCMIGANGAGKTTLTRLIAGELQPQEGSLEVGQRVKIGYYAQHQVDALNLEATVYEEVVSTVADRHVPRVRDVLGVFQFRGDDVLKKIKVLSGGEKARVSLAKILLSPVNFLIMDEPTNHLDRTSREALEHALSEYNGTLLLISHDRYFLDKLVHRVVELKDGRFTEYDGNYSYYLDKRAEELSGDTAVPPTKDPAAPAAKQGQAVPNRQAVPAGKKTKEQKRLEAQARQAVSKDLNRLRNEVARLEDKITHLEKSKTALEQQLARPETYDDGPLAVSLQKEYAAVNKDLEQFTALWEEALTRLEHLKTDLMGSV